MPYIKAPPNRILMFRVSQMFGLCRNANETNLGVSLILYERISLAKLIEFVTVQIP